MVKIIKHGKLPSEKEYNGKCKNCGCEFIFKAKDAKMEYGRDQRDGNFLVINCPENCGTKIYKSE